MKRGVFVCVVVLATALACLTGCAASSQSSSGEADAQSSSSAADAQSSEAASQASENSSSAAADESASSSSSAESSQHSAEPSQASESGSPAAVESAPFPSWNADADSLAKLVAYVEAATEEGGAGYVPPEDRIAVFDMD